jgi:hypothetical protein
VSSIRAKRNQESEQEETTRTAHRKKSYLNQNINLPNERVVTLLLFLIDLELN